LFFFQATRARDRTVKDIVRYALLLSFFLLFSCYNKTFKFVIDCTHRIDTCNLCTNLDRADRWIVSFYAYPKIEDTRCESAPTNRQNPRCQCTIAQYDGGRGWRERSREDRVRWMRDSRPWSTTFEIQMGSQKNSNLKCAQIEDAPRRIF